MCVFEKDEKGEDDAGYHEGALEGEHRGSKVGVCRPEEKCRRWCAVVRTRDLVALRGQELGACSDEGATCGDQAWLEGCWKRGSRR